MHSRSMPQAQNRLPFGGFQGFPSGPSFPGAPTSMGVGTMGMMPPPGTSHYADPADQLTTNVAMPIRADVTNGRRGQPQSDRIAVDQLVFTATKLFPGISERYVSNTTMPVWSLTGLNHHLRSYAGRTQYKDVHDFVNTGSPCRHFEWMGVQNSMRLDSIHVKEQTKIQNIAVTSYGRTMLNCIWCPRSRRRTSKLGLEDDLVPNVGSYLWLIWANRKSGTASAASSGMKRPRGYGGAFTDLHEDMDHPLYDGTGDSFWRVEPFVTPDQNPPPVSIYTNRHTMGKAICVARVTATYGPKPDEMHGMRDTTDSGIYGCGALEHCNSRVWSAAHVEVCVRPHHFHSE